MSIYHQRSAINGITLRFPSADNPKVREAVGKHLSLGPSKQIWGTGYSEIIGTYRGDTTKREAMEAAINAAIAAAGSVPMPEAETAPSSTPSQAATKSGT